jgi:hypothetical protein
VSYDVTGVTLLTLGNTQHATWAWRDECADEAYAILSPQAQASDFARLEADLADVAN